MSLLFKRDLTLSDVGVPERSATQRSVSVTGESAMRHSAVWACLRLRGDLISTMPVDLYRKVGGVDVEVPKSSFLEYPGGPRVHITEWLYSSQVDLDRYGNALGVISQRDGAGNPARVDLVPAGDAHMRIVDGEVVEYRFGRKLYDPLNVWHERQFTVAGLPVGLSPISYAAMSIGGYLSAQQFALDWFLNGAGPSGHLKNTQKTVAPGEASTIKDRFKTAILGRDVFVSGNDWDYTPSAAAASDAGWLEQMSAGIPDVARFFGSPADLIDAAVSGQSVTYANITQRNLQLLIMNLGPAIVRREVALTAATPKPRRVKLNSDALLRMDPETREQTILARVAGRTLAPSEARALNNLPPLTDIQIAEFDRLFGQPRTPTPEGTPKP